MNKNDFKSIFEFIEYFDLLTNHQPKKTINIIIQICTKNWFWQMGNKRGFSRLLYLAPKLGARHRVLPGGPYHVPWLGEEVKFNSFLSIWRYLFSFLMPSFRVCHIAKSHWMHWEPNFAFLWLHSFANCLLKRHLIRHLIGHF